MKKLSLTVLFLASISAAVASPVGLGTVVAPIVPKTPTAVGSSSMLGNVLHTYKQVRTFWLSRAIVR